MVSTHEAVPEGGNKVSESRNSLIADGVQEKYLELRDDAEPLDMLKWELTALKLGGELEIRQRKKEESSWERVNKVKKSLAEEIELRRKRPPSFKSSGKSRRCENEPQITELGEECNPITATRSLDISSMQVTTQSGGLPRRYRLVSSPGLLPQVPKRCTSTIQYDYGERSDECGYPVYREKTVSPSLHSSIVKSPYQGRIDKSFSNEEADVILIDNGCAHDYLTYEVLKADELEAEYVRLLQTKRNQLSEKKIFPLPTDTYQSVGRLNKIRRTSMVESKGSSSFVENEEKNNDVHLIENVENISSQIVIHLEELHEVESEKEFEEKTVQTTATQPIICDPFPQRAASPISFSSGSMACDKKESNNRLTCEKDDGGVGTEQLEQTKHSIGHNETDPGLSSVEKLVSGYFTIRKDIHEGQDGGIAYSFFGSTTFADAGCCISRY